MKNIQLKSLPFPRYLIHKVFHKGSIGLADVLHCSSFPIPFWRKRELMQKYNLYNYNIESFRPLFKATPLKSRKVLELGGSNLPPELLFHDFGAEQWTSVDYFNWWGDIDPTQKNTKISNLKIVPLNEVKPEDLLEKHLICNGSAAEIPEVFAENYDVAVSICAMEHMMQLPVILKKIWMALKPGGIFYSNFAPIWSGPNGSHFWISDDFNFNNAQEYGISPYVHLLETPETFVQKMGKSFDEGLTKRLVNEIFHSDKINHLFLKDYIQMLQESPFTNWKISSTAPRLPQKIARELKKCCPMQDGGFEFYNLVIIAQK